MSCSKLSHLTRYKTNDGYSSPVLGLGLYQEQYPGDVETAVLTGLKCGFKMLDTSPLYHNEEEIGAALKKSGVAREDVYITSKLWIDSHGREGTVKALHQSLNKMGLAYVDRYLINSHLGSKILETWDTMIELQQQGLIRSIGVVNFGIEYLREMMKARPNNVPAVNQIEVSVTAQHIPEVEFCQREGILVEAFFPGGRGFRLEKPAYFEIAQRYNKSPMQLMIRWCLQHDILCVTKSLTEKNIILQGDVFDFEITKEDMAVLDSVNQDHRGSWNPLGVLWGKEIREF